MTKLPKDPYKQVQYLVKLLQLPVNEFWALQDVCRAQSKRGGCDLFEIMARKMRHKYMRRRILGIFKRGKG